MASEWISYNELAWTEEYLADPSDYEDEVETYCRLILDAAHVPVRTMLHFGCGTGGHDRFFKKYFHITGVDLSAGMLKMTRAANPEIEYIEADMRTVKLERRFDAVVIPDSIDYMASEDDLRKAIETAALHLRPGGVLLIVGKTAETFRNNNFAYSGERGDTHVTLFENNYIDPYHPNSYQITLLYLIRRRGILETFIEETTAGLFPEATWDRIFSEHDFTLRKHSLDGLYDEYLIGEGEYPLTVFVGRKDG
ncbi:MAG TPA: class I SAM-dependent methyltransferase [Sediminispirochaeta sp.]|nr:class I SAM-dependent methyltransferase [Sediminispirochaeta sp.]